MSDLYQPVTIAAALAALSDLGAQGAVMAGGTWIMRAPLRQEPMARTYVATWRIPTLHQIEITETHVRIGSGITHAGLAEELHEILELRGLVAAASGSANPAVRQVATLGGNICTSGFYAADLVPALLCQNAEVDVETLQDRQRMSLQTFLEVRGALPAYLLTGVLIPRRPVISAHARLPLRKAGDYPVTIVSAAVERRADGTIGDAAIGVGSVEMTARRWRRLEEAVLGLPLNARRIEKCATDLAEEFIGRDGPETPGWYRVQVLPALVRRAFENLEKLSPEEGRHVDPH
ncbi:carbon-monoxide dehydrogenase medium subunit [Rhizobium sp. PP-F2F-G48]|uniref:FAD binding domain-containing protein n=1 Tax=Rhizobium sp. PP-F2F-G48 TaxID=2135651 RepID=UPI0010538CE1|nr:FAD binding domain-containing protein [Rhizobium sp. PP-F2F-G48]TCM51086.1 carbon-monoxide dehydrogenase medium subunit [Rhizobium sp. PP-F2F-G48]